MSFEEEKEIDADGVRGSSAAEATPASNMETKTKGKGKESELVPSLSPQQAAYKAANSQQSSDWRAAAAAGGRKKRPRKAR